MSDLVIPLTQGRVTLVDPEDFAALSQFRWYLKMLGTPGAEKPYAARNAPSGTRRQVTLLMHRVITNAPKGVHVDHINGDSLDNRRENLRFSTQAGNAQNRPLSRLNTSGFKGVYPQGKGWAAKVNRQYLGIYRTPEEAARAYDTQAREMYGKFARLNFPDSTEIVNPRKGTNGHRTRLTHLP